MIQYITGTALTLSLAIIFQLFGICLTKNKKSYSYSFIVGYIIYSFFVAVVGIPIQFLNLPWKFFFIYMILLLMAIIIYIIYHLYNKKIILSKKVLLEYLKENWFLYVGAILITGLALSSISTIWSNNLTDDSYYLNKIATLPYLENPFRTDYTTGLADSKINTYLFNTFELEASFYVYITGIYVTLYARLFLALLNYFILLNAIKAFMIEVFDKTNMKISNGIVQYIVVPIFVLIVMCSILFISSESHWTMYSAAYYGSAFVRIGAVFIPLIPLVNKDKLDFKLVLITIINCIVLISKSTVAIPVLLLMACGYLLSIISKKKWYLYVLFVGLIIVAGLVLPNKNDINQNDLSLIISNLIHPLTIFSLFAIVIFSISNRIYLRITCIIVTSILLIILPEINDIFEFVSNYSFVADRAIYSLFSFVLITSLISVAAFIASRISKERLVRVLGSLSTCCLLGSIIVTGFSDYDFVNAIKIYSKNMYLVPTSTIALGEKIEQYYIETGTKPIVIMPAGYSYESYSHFPAQILLSFSPHAISLVAGLRTQQVYENESTIFNGFSFTDNEILTNFILDPNEETLNELNELNEKYPFNCIVLINGSELHQNLLGEMGYVKYDEVLDNNLYFMYHVYIKNE